MLAGIRTGEEQGWKVAADSGNQSLPVVSDDRKYRCTGQGISPG